jgi:hypothetical protein
MTPTSWKRLRATLPAPALMLYYEKNSRPSMLQVQVHVQLLPQKTIIIAYVMDLTIFHTCIIEDISLEFSKVYASCVSV